MLSLCLLTFLLSASISASKAEIWGDCGYHSNKVPDTFKVHFYDILFVPFFERSSFHGQIDIHLDLIDPSKPVTKIILNASRALKFGPIKVQVSRKPPLTEAIPTYKSAIRIEEVCRDQNYDIISIDVNTHDALKAPVYGYVLKIRFSGEFDQNHPGLHMINYTDPNRYNQVVYGLYTTFERENARTVFPCLDDARFPAHFRLRLELPPGYSGVTNTSEKFTETGSSSRIMVQEFGRTSMIAPQQFGFAIGCFFEKSFRTGPKSNLVIMSTLPFDRELDQSALVVVNSYTKIQERVGLWDRTVPIIALLPGVGDREFHGPQIMVADQSWLNSFATLKPHEETYYWYHSTVRRLAKQWFGGHIIRRSANDIWLFDSLLSYTSIRLAGGLYKRKKFSAIMHYVSTSYWSALISDAQIDSEPVMSANSDHDEEQPDFNISNVARVKSLALIRVLREICGKQDFNGLMSNLEIFRGGTLNTANFFQGVSERCSADIGPFVDSLLYKPGFPLIVVDLEDDGTIVITSERFRSDYSHEWPDFEDHQYSLPISLRFARISDDTDVVKSALMISQKVSRHPSPVPMDQWCVTTNMTSVEYYRTLYSDELMQKISQSRIPYTNLLNLIGDAFALVQAGRVGVHYLLRAIDPVRRIECGWLDDAVLRVLQWLKLLYRDTSSEDDINNYIINFLGPKFEKRKFVLTRMRSNRARRAQVWMYETLANLGFRPLVQATLARQNELMSEANFQTLVYIVLSRYGTDREFLTLLESFEDATNSELRKKITSSLAMTSNRARLQTAWLTVLEHAPAQALDFLLISLLNPEGREFVEDLLKDLEKLRLVVGIQGVYRVLKEFSIVAQEGRSLPTKLTGFTMESAAQITREVQTARHRNNFIRNRDIEKLSWAALRNPPTSSQIFIEEDPDDHCD